MKHAPVPGPTASRVTEMRVEFDVTFARLPQPHRHELDEVLEVVLGEDSCALRISEIAEVIARPALTAVPTTADALVGIAGSQRGVVAVYDLGVLLGGPRTAAGAMVLAAAEPTVAVTFDRLEGYRQLRRGRPGRLTIIPMATLLDSIRALARPAAETD
jgi:purine-binding chemotaxis protein CheW